jgi:hypothetical protein
MEVLLIQTRSRQSSRRVLASVFLVRGGLSPVNYFEGGANVMAKYCVALHDKLKQQPVSKLRGKLF